MPFVLNIATKKTFLLFCLMACWHFFPQQGLAQQERAMQWVFPRQNGLDFGTNSPTPYTTAIPAGSSLTQGSSTISDLNGDLLFYSNGEKVWNRNHVVMPNGGALVGSQEATQSSIIVPYPNYDSRYFLFTLSDNGAGQGLNYYLIDMNMAFGLGDVASPAFQLSDTMTEKLCATKHANDLDYWVISHPWNSDSFLVYHVDTFGVSAPIISETGLRHSGAINGVMGQMKVSPDGRRLALANFAAGFVQLFDFNNATGVVSNPLTIVHQGTHFPHGVEFSQDSRKLYYVQRFSSQPEARLYQLDLDHLDTNCLLNSRVEIMYLNALKVPSNLQLGINGKIYMGVNYFPTYDTLSVIHFPNEYGVACGFEEFDILCDHPVSEGLPNFPSSYLGGGLVVEFGTTCEGSPTWMYPEDTLGIDSVRWYFGDQGATSTDMHASHIYSAPDTFQITLYTYRNGQADTFHRDVIIWDIAEDLLGNDTTICQTGSVTLDAAWYDACLYWFDGSINTQMTVSSEGWYWVDVYHQSCHFRDSMFIENVSTPPVFSLGNDTLVCTNVSFTIDPDLANAFYTWQDGSHDTTFSVTQTGAYSLTATNACGSSADTLNVILNTATQAISNLPSDTTLCDTSQLVVNIAIPDGAYLWSDGTTSATKTFTESGLYFVTISNVCDSAYDTIQVVYESTLIGSLDERMVLCPGTDSLVLQVNNDRPVVQWNAVVDSQLVVKAPGTYWYFFENTCGSSSDTSVVMLWDTAFTIDIGTDTVVCDPTFETTLFVTTKDFPFSIQWNTGASDTAVTAAVGAYAVVVSNRCATLEDARIIRLADAIVMEEPLDRTVCDGKTVTLSLNSELFAEADWSNGGTGISCIATEAGLLEVSVTDSFGCVFSDSIYLDDHCPLKVFVPNVFTPGKDGINDAFCPVVENASNVRLHVFDRWGLSVYTGETNELCWDGNLKSGSADSGVYFYIVEAEDFEGTMTSYRGSFQLLR